MVLELYGGRWDMRYRYRTNLLLYKKSFQSFEKIGIFLRVRLLRRKEDCKSVILRHVGEDD